MGAPAIGKHLATFNLFREADNSLHVTIAEAAGVREELGDSGAPLQLCAMQALRVALGGAAPLVDPKPIAQAIHDPGATEGYKGNRTLTEWQTAAVMRVLRAMLAFNAPAAETASELSEAWKQRAHRAAGLIDALLLYATRYPTDSHALDAYTFLLQLNRELGNDREPRTVATFGQHAEGRPLVPPLREIPTGARP